MSYEKTLDISYTHCDALLGTMQCLLQHNEEEEAFKLWEYISTLYTNTAEGFLEAYENHQDYIHDEL